MIPQDELLLGELQDAIDGKTCMDCKHIICEYKVNKRYFCKLHKSKHSASGCKSVKKSKPACWLFEESKTN